MLEIVNTLFSLDLSLTQEASELRWGPSTAVFTVASAWWVKGGLLLALGGLSDIWRRRAVPVALLTTTAAFLVASLLNAILKVAFERPRPPLADTGIQPAVELPSSWSFPSGHAMTSFAAATAIAVLCPRARWPALALATLIAVSRPFLGVHFWLDVIAGALLGVLTGVAVAVVVRRRVPA